MWLYYIVLIADIHITIRQLCIAPIKAASFNFTKYTTRFVRAILKIA